MSEAQLATYGTRRKQIRMSNEQVYELLRRFAPDEAEPAATPEQLIDFATSAQTMSAVQGKRISQPIYRALSEGADEGLLSDDESVVNPETGARNTLYRLLKVKRPARIKKDTWKERALAAEKAFKILQEVSAAKIADLEAQLEAALELATSPAKVG